MITMETIEAHESDVSCREAESSKCLNNTLDARLELTRVKGEVCAQKQIFRTISESGRVAFFFYF